MMHFPARAVPMWGHDQHVAITLTGADTLMLSTVRDHMVAAGWNADVLTPAFVLAAALDMAVAYIDTANKRMEVGDGHQG